MDRDVFLIIAGIGGGLTLIGAMCQHPVADPESATCVSARAALELRCVDQASTRDEADRCRAAVRAAHDCLTDGGAHE
jgi:hypothetical protein